MTWIEPPGELQKKDCGLNPLDGAVYSLLLILLRKGKKDI